MELSCPLGIRVLSRKEHLSCYGVFNKSFIDQACSVKMVNNPYLSDCSPSQLKYREKKLSSWTQGIRVQISRKNSNLVLCAHATLKCQMFGLKERKKLNSKFFIRHLVYIITIIIYYSTKSRPKGQVPKKQSDWVFFRSHNSLNHL